MPTPKTKQKKAEMSPHSRLWKLHYYFVIYRKTFVCPFSPTGIGKSGLYFAATDLTYGKYRDQGDDAPLPSQHATYTVRTWHCSWLLFLPRGPRPPANCSYQIPPFWLRLILETSICNHIHLLAKKQFYHWKNNKWKNLCQIDTRSTIWGVQFISIQLRLGNFVYIIQINFIGGNTPQQLGYLVWHRRKWRPIITGVLEWLFKFAPGKSKTNIKDVLSPERALPRLLQM